MHPSERLRIVIETARAVLDGRIDAETAADALAMQREQIGDRLQSDRLDVTTNEARQVATTLRRLGEQITDRAAGLPDPAAHHAAAEVLGRLANSLR